MALVKTDVLPCGSKFSCVSEMVRALQGAIADELSAANLYMELLEYFEKAGQNEVTYRLREILADERTHAGSLLWCVQHLNCCVAEQITKGMEGA